jgi:hypothetical protein
MVDAALADNLTVGMLCGEDENERGRRSGTPSFFENGCEDKHSQWEVLQKRGSATILVSKALGLFVRTVSLVFTSSADDL